MLKIFKINKEAEVPVYSTDMAAGFDIKACLLYQSSIKGYTTTNADMVTFVTMDENKKCYILIPQNWRCLIPTGIVLDIPEEHYVEIYSRSGTAIKKGLTLINSVGIIDEDYTKELFIPFINLSQEPVRIYHGDRIAQGILKKSIRPIIIETPERPVKESNRDGGFGSTGV